MRKSDLYCGMVAGVMIFLGFLFQTLGIRYTTAGKNAFLTAVYVVLVPFLSWIVKRKNPGAHHLIAAAICLTGIGFLTLNTSLQPNIGDILTLFCSLCFAAHILCVEIFTQEHDPILLTVIQLITATALSFLAALFFEPFPTHMETSAIGGLFYLGILSTLTAFLLQNVCQKYTTPHHASIMLCFESVFGSAMSILILGELFNIHMIMGCALIFIALLISESFTGKKPKSVPEVQPLRME